MEPSDPATVFETWSVLGFVLILIPLIVGAFVGWAVVRAIRAWKDWPR